MNQLRLPIDHIGILAPEIQSLVTEFRTLGFNVVGPAELTSIDSHGDRRGLGQYSAHVMLDDDYIELTAVERPTPDHHLAQFLRNPWGVRILILSCDDIDSQHQECESKNLQPSPVNLASRILDYRDGAEAQFKWFGLPATSWPDALVGYVEHLTKDLVFDRSVSQHENGARGLNRLYYFADSLPEQYAKLDTGGTHGLQLVSPDSRDNQPGQTMGVSPAFAAVGIDVDDLETTANYFTDKGIAWQREGDGISVQLESGINLIFM